MMGGEVTVTSEPGKAQSSRCGCRPGRTCTKLAPGDFGVLGAFRLQARLDELAVAA